MNTRKTKENIQKETGGKVWKGFLAFLKRKDIEISAKRYGVDALGAMAQGRFYLRRLYCAPYSGSYKSLSTSIAETRQYVCCP